MGLTAEVEITVDVECDECGATLRADQPGSKPKIKVKPCEDCMAAAKEEGRNE